VIGRPRLPTGIRWHLTAWVAFVMVLAYAAVFIAVYRGTATAVRHDIDQDIRGDLLSFATAVEQARPPAAAQLRRAARRYVEGQPFHANATVLFATIGTVTVTNQPELFRRGPPDPNEGTVRQLREARADLGVLHARDGTSVVALADTGPLRLIKATLRIGGVPVALGVGESLLPVANAQHGVAHAFVIAGAIALALALASSLLVGSRVAAPLRRIAAVASRVDSGDLRPRIAGHARRRSEIQVLGDAFNAMLDRLEGAFASQRQFVADASHELRTPLTVIRGQLEVLAAEHPEDPGVARAVELAHAEVDRLRRLTDDLFLLASAQEGDLIRAAPISLPEFVGDLWAGLAATGARRFELGPVPDGILLADPDRLAQVLRNLITNAIDHTASASGMVALRTTALDGGRVRFAVRDDGPGIPAEMRERVFDRLVRVDRARARSEGGAGLGLAIVEAHGGTVAAFAPATGGTVVEVELPSFSALDDEQPAAAPVRPRPPLASAGVE